MSIFLTVDLKKQDKTQREEKIWTFQEFCRGLDEGLLSVVVGPTLELFDVPDGRPVVKIEPYIDTGIFAA